MISSFGADSRECRKFRSTKGEIEPGEYVEEEGDRGVVQESDCDGTQIRTR